MNWGQGIAIFYTGFVIIMVSMVVMSTRNRADLVEKEYYTKDINYEKFRKKRENGHMVSGLQINKQDENLSIGFPKGMDIQEGDVHFFRPSDSKLDRHFAIEVDTSNLMNIDISPFPKGLWRIKTEWNDKGKTYFDEQKVTF